jgi:hypothetical protein
MYHNFTVIAHVAAVSGPRQGDTNAWNAHEWELR